MFVAALKALDMVNASVFPTTKQHLGMRGRNARMLKMVYDYMFKAKWARKTFKTALDKRAAAYMAAKATKIQSRIRGVFGRERYRIYLARHRDAIEHQRRMRAATKLQSVVRRFITRCFVIRLAQDIIIKYMESNAVDPYWSNPRTGVTTWTRPKILGLSDIDYPTLLPNKSTEYLIICVSCAKSQAESICHSCDDAFCNDCFKNLHTKGRRREHTAIPIAMCFVCHYQMASRVCQTCTAEKQIPATMCDVCFHNVHSHTKRVHRASSLVIMCVECNQFAARWRCHECEDVYCTDCFARVHRRGNKVSHTYELLSYYTPIMHDHYERDCRENARRRRKEQELRLLEAAKLAAHNSAAVAIQRRYRGMKGRAAGIMLLKEARAKIREQWRKKKEHEARLRKFKLKKAKCVHMRCSLASRHLC
jgi:hypothetical protein